MPDRQVMPRQHTREQKRVLRRLEDVCRRLNAHKADLDERNKLYLEGRAVGLLYDEMAQIAGVSEVGVINAVRRTTEAAGGTRDASPRVRRRIAKTAG